MSRRTDLVQQLVASDKFGQDKDNEQKFMLATAELILGDLINKAIDGLENFGAGSLVINLLTDNATYMTGEDIEVDLMVAESLEDEDTIDFLRELLERVDSNDFSKNLLITLISDAGTRTFAVEAGRSQESFRAIASEFTN